MYQVCVWRPQFLTASDYCPVCSKKVMFPFTLRSRNKNLWAKYYNKIKSSLSQPSWPPSLGKSQSHQTFSSNDEERIRAKRKISFGAKTQEDKSKQQRMLNNYGTCVWRSSIQPQMFLWWSKVMLRFHTTK